jgi:hypothetical protein
VDRILKTILFIVLNFNKLSVLSLEYSLVPFLRVKIFQTFANAFIGFFSFGQLFAVLFLNTLFR